MNPFDSGTMVARYAAGRPYHHGRTVRRALGDRRYDRALDVACGTGLSTRALAERGTAVVGVDVVPAMVAWARRTTGLPYAVGSAEALPVADRGVDLVAVSSGVHWFAAGPFAAEAARVLRPGGALLLYEHAGARLPDEPAFDDWLRAHQRRHPAPPRGPLAGRAEPAGFTRVAADAWPDPVRFDRDGFADHLMSQSNLAGAADGVRDRLVAGLAPFFPAAREVVFSASYQLFAAPGPPPDGAGRGGRPPRVPGRGRRGLRAEPGDRAADPGRGPAGRQVGGGPGRDRDGGWGAGEDGGRPGPGRPG